MPSVTSPASPAALTPRRRELLDAAVHVVADEGLRGLTHRAVDRRAGFPEGTCSAYFRTRQALQLAVTEYVAATMAADVDALGAELVECSGDEARAVALTLALFERWLDERELILAKLELSLEAPRNPAVAEALAASRVRLVGVVDGLLSQADRERGDGRAEALVASFDGLLFAALQKPQRERRAFLSGSLALVMHALTTPEG
ncbi:MAG TPA: TetR family transcriptional regulator [Nocardioides sp.]|uniref:TetR/AcrR family transcriptional regulator n=1 Tax=Nocardioides sp. TaxID=35761 RepID=UPI002E3456F3|nr:TetR family transcriptional regulator [Nocardioides sp.]HEX5090561.1 TetR family transcriptional regulator [Nocardioides sp.]